MLDLLIVLILACLVAAAIAGGKGRYKLGRFLLALLYLLLALFAIFGTNKAFTFTNMP